MGDNRVVLLSAADFTALALAVGAHVDACYRRQAALDEENAAAPDEDSLVAIDTAAGWPGGGTVPGFFD